MNDILSCYMNKRPSIIFDIDGTLLYARGVGREAFGVAFEAAYRTPYPDVGKLCFVGATDSNVVRTMAQECNLENTTAQEEHFFFKLTQEVDQGLARTKPSIYPGVPQLLSALREAGFPLGIITGNIRPTAWSKLRHAGIDNFFSFGAYGDDHHDRCEITKIARARAPSHAPIAMLIGDTPLDIKAAKSNNLVALATATGWVSAAELTAAGADLVLQDFSDTQGCLAQILALLE